MDARTNLCEVILNGNRDKLLDLLREKLDLSTITGVDVALYLALKDEKYNQTQLTDILGVFLDQGFDINRQIVRGKTVLHLAVERRMREVINFCLRRGADIKMSDSHGNTIAHFVIEKEGEKFLRHIENGVTQNLESLEYESSSFVQWMISKGADFIYKRNRIGQSALSLAIKLNLQHILLALLKHVDELPLAGHNQKSPLCAFFERNGDTKIPIKNYYKSRHVYSIVNVMLDKDFSIDDATLTRALCSAISSDSNVDAIDPILELTFGIDSARHQLLLQTFADKFLEWKEPSKREMGTTFLSSLILKGVDVNRRDSNGNTFAHTLFRRHPKLEMLEILSEGSVDLDERTTWGDNLLHLVSQYGNEAGMVDLVASDSCDVNVVNHNQETPLKLAIKCMKDVVAVRLIELGAKVNDVYADGKSLLGLACTWNMVAVAEKLIEYGADLGYRDEFDRTLLHISADSLEMVELLVKSGMDVDARDKMGRTPLQCALKNYTLDSVVKILLSAGAHVDVQDEAGSTPLYEALQSWRCCETIAELLKCGADVQDPKVLELVRERSKKPYIIGNKGYDYFKKHLCKMDAAGLLDSLPLQSKDMNGDWFEFKSQCMKEVEKLKSFLIDDRTSLYDLLHKTQSRRCAYLRNVKLKNLVEDVQIEKKFPIYFVVILNCYNAALRWKSLLQQARKAWYKITFVNLPDLCTYQIHMYLSNSDIVRFIGATEIVGIDVSTRSDCKAMENPVKKFRID